MNNQMTAGELLKQGRLRQKLSISECAKRTHISVRFLEALEAERWDDLPSESHRVGFLQLYSRFLGVSSDEVLGLYKSEKALPPETAPAAATPEIPAKQAPAAAKPAVRPSSFSLESPAQLLVLALLILIAAWVGYHALAKKDISELGPKFVYRERPKQSRLVAPKPTNTVQRLKVQAQGDSWLRLTEAGQLRYEGIVSAGSTKEWNGQGPFNLKMGNIRAVTVTWNDQPIDLTAKSRGAIHEVQLPPQKASGQ